MLRRVDRRCRVLDVRFNRKRGITCLTPEELLREEASGSYSLLVMSHIIEHFEYSDLRKLIESYLDCLAENGHLLIATPLLHWSFYNDFDHVKPYYPIGLQMVFGEGTSQVQFQSDRMLRLEDIDFFKDQLRLQFYRGLFLPDAASFPIHLNRVLKLLFVLSGGSIGRKVGWIGLYRYLGRRASNPAPR